METLVKLNPLSAEIWGYLAIDVGIALILLFVVRWMSGRVTKISVSNELGSDCMRNSFGLRAIHLTGK